MVTFNKALQNIVRRKAKTLVPGLKMISASVKIRIRQLIIQNIKNSNVYQAISEDETFIGELGFEDGRNRLDIIIEQWVSTLRVEFIRGTNKDSGGGVRVVGITTDFSDILNMNEAKFTTPENGHILPWLDWLLTKGVSILIDDYGFISKDRVSLDKILRYSRTGQGLMSDKIKGKFHIRHSFSGTVDDNFMINAVKAIQGKDIHAIVRSEISRIL